MIICFGLPILITILYFLFHHGLPDFFQSAFLGNIDYVGYKNTFIIPQGFLILKLLLLFSYLLFIIFKRNTFSHTSLFILLWVGFSLFSVFFSQRPYPHYVLMLLPSFCLLVGLIFAVRTPTTKIALISFVLLIVLLVGQTFNLTNFEKSFLYYPNASAYILGNKDITNYQAFFDTKTPRDYELASFIKNHTKNSDTIFVWGDSPQIYSLTNKLPIGKYTVAYHITQNKERMQETQTAINTIKPKYVIILQEAPTFPFQIPLYVNKFTLKGATIYEKAF
jgi:hypothetical protein